MSLSGEILDILQGIGGTKVGDDLGPARRQIEALVAAEREACAKLALERKSYHMPIPCPDNKPGCLVMHAVPGTRDKTPAEIAADIRARSETHS